MPLHLRLSKVSQPHCVFPWPSFLRFMNTRVPVAEKLEATVSCERNKEMCRITIRRGCSAVLSLVSDHSADCHPAVRKQHDAV